MSTVGIFDGPDIFDPLIFDTRIKSVFVTINDEGGNVSDLLAKQVKYRRTFLEGEVAMFDVDIFDLAIFDTEGGAGSIIFDTVVASKSNPVILTEAAIIVSDLLTRILKAKVTLVETVTSSDSVVASKSNPVILTEAAIIVSDLLTRILKAKVTLVETVTSSDSITRLVKYFRSITEGEGGNVSDLLAKQVKYRRTFLEGEAAIIVSDLLTRILKAKVTLVETVTSSDSVARIAKYFRNLTESGGGMFDGGIFDSLIFDIQFGTIQVTDSIVAIGGKVVSLSDTVTITEDLQRMLKSFVTFTETTIISELINAKKSAFRLLSDTVPNTEDLARTLKAFRSFTEPSIIISDAIASVRGAKIVFLENTIVSDVLTRLTKQFRSLSDTNTVSDILAVFKVVGRRSKQAFAWINKRTTKAFIFKRKTNAYANNRKTSARV